MDRNRWSLEGQRALVTGASAGIGLAICRELLGLGAQVLMVAREATALERARAELEEEFPGPRTRCSRCRPTSPTRSNARRSWTGPPTRAGCTCWSTTPAGNPTRPALDYGEDQWRGIFETNLFSAFELCRAAHPQLARHATSSIVNIGSVSGITHAQRRAVRHEQGRAAPDDPQPRGWNGPRTAYGELRRAVVHPHPPHGEAVRSRLPRRSPATHADIASANLRKSPGGRVPVHAGVELRHRRMHRGRRRFRATDFGARTRSGVAGGEV